jgi:hypothetical protein
VSFTLEVAAAFVEAAEGEVDALLQPTRAAAREMAITPLVRRVLVRMRNMSCSGVV